MSLEHQIKEHNVDKMDKEARSIMISEIDTRG